MREKFVGYMLLNTYKGALGEYNGRFYTLQQARKELQSPWGRGLKLAKVYLVLD